MLVFSWAWASQVGCPDADFPEASASSFIYRITDKQAKLKSNWESGISLMFQRHVYHHLRSSCSHDALPLLFCAHGDMMDLLL